MIWVHHIMRVLYNKSRRIIDFFNAAHRLLVLGKENKDCSKMKFSMKDFFSKCDRICNFLQIWSHLLMKSIMENFIFCAVKMHTA